MRHTKMRYLFLSLFVLLLIGCGSTNSVTTVAVKGIELSQYNNLGSGDSYKVKCKLDVNGSEDNIGLFLSLVPKKDIPQFSDDEDNSILNFTPSKEYHLGATRLEISPQTDTYEATITLPNKISIGEYKLVALLDDSKSNGAIDFVDGDVIIDDKIATVATEHKLPLFKLEEFTIDNDVLLLDMLNDDNITIQTTLSVSSKYYDSENIKISTCLDLGNGCLGLGILGTDGLLKAERIIEKVSSYTTHIALDITISRSVIVDILNMANLGLATGNIIVKVDGKDINSPLHSESSKTISSKISIYDVTNQIRDNDELLHYFKTYTLKKLKTRFGSKLTLDSQTGVGLEGAYAFSHGDLLVRVFGKDLNFMHVGVDANFVYSSFDDSGIETSVKFLGMTIKDFKDMHDDIKSSIKTFKDIVENGKSVPKNWNVSLEKLKKVKLIKTPPNASVSLKNKIKKANLKKINGSIKSLKALTKPYSITKSKGYSQQFMLSIVPVVVEAGAGGEFGYTPSIGITGITGLEASVELGTSIGGYASGGVGVTGFSAGVEANFDFIDDSLEAKSGFELTLDGDDKNLLLNGDTYLTMDNTITGPNGSIDLYAKYTKPKICANRKRYCIRWNWHGHCTRHKSYTIHYPCGFKTYKPTKNIFSWKSFENTKNLLKKSDHLFDIKLY